LECQNPIASEVLDIKLGTCDYHVRVYAESNYDGSHVATDN